MDKSKFGLIHQLQAIENNKIQWNAVLTANLRLAMLNLDPFIATPLPIPPEISPERWQGMLKHAWNS